MSGIVRRLEWDRQPRISGRPNVANSVASALGALLRFDEFGIFDVAGSIGFQPAAQFTRHNTTHGIGYGRTAYGSGQPAVASPFGTGPFSAVVFAAPASAAAITPFFSWRDDGGGEQCSFAANTDAGFTPAAGSVTMTTATGLVLEAPGALTGVTSVYGFSVTSASSGTIYVDGVAKTTNAYNTGLLTPAPRPFYVASHLGSVSVHNEPIYHIATFNRSLSPAEHAALARWLYHLYEPEQIYVPFASSGATDYPVTATDALTLADSASNVAALSAASANALTLSDAASNVAAMSAAATDALTLADSASNVAAFAAASANAMTLADSASNVAALSATATDALALADTLNASTSGDYTAVSSNALTLADSASNVAALSATATDAMALADTINGSASGDYVVVATDALSLSDARSAAFAAVAVATDALTLADAINAALSGQYTATATDALALSDTRSNAAALSASIAASMALAELVSAANSGSATSLLGIRGEYGVQIQTTTRRPQIQSGPRRR